MAETRAERRARLQAELAAATSPAERLSRLLALADELSDGAALESEPLAREALELAKGLGDKSSEAAACRHLANIALRAGDDATARAQVRRALELAQAAGDAKQEASAWSLLSAIHLARAEYDEARTCSERCVAAAERAGYALGVQSARNELGNIALLQGRLEEALAHYQACLQMNEETGDRYSGAGLHVNIGLVLGQLGRWEDAVGCLERAIAICDQYGFGDIGAYAKNALGELWLGRGRAMAAAELFEQVVAAGRSRVTTVMVLRDGLVNLGRARARLGEVDAAERAFAEALELCRSGQDRRGEVVCLLRMAELAVVQNDSAAAGRLAAAAQALARELGLRTEEGTAMLVYALLAEQAGEIVRAQQQFEQTLEVLGSGEESYESARARFEFGRFLLRQGEAGPAREQLSVAAGVFRRLGAADDARFASRLLFELDCQQDPEAALLTAISGLTALGLPPREHVVEALVLLTGALGCDWVGVTVGDEVIAEYGSRSAGGDEGSLPLPVLGGGEIAVRLRPALAAARFSPAVVQTAIGLLVVPVQRMLADDGSKGRK